MSSDMSNTLFFPSYYGIRVYPVCARRTKENAQKKAGTTPNASAECGCGRTTHRPRNCAPYTYIRKCIKEANKKCLTADAETICF